jgi:hypothetical protein
VFVVKSVLENERYELKDETRGCPMVVGVKYDVAIYIYLLRIMKWYFVGIDLNPKVN